MTVTRSWEEARKDSSFVTAALGSECADWWTQKLADGQRVFSVSWVTAAGSRVDFPALLSFGLFFEKHPHLCAENAGPGAW